MEPQNGGSVQSGPEYDTPPITIAGLDLKRPENVPVVMEYLLQQESAVMVNVMATMEAVLDTALGLRGEFVKRVTKANANHLRKIARLRGRLATVLDVHIGNSAVMSADDQISLAEADSIPPIDEPPTPEECYNKCLAQGNTPEECSLRCGYKPPIKPPPPPPDPPPPPPPPPPPEPPVAYCDNFQIVHAWDCYAFPSNTPPDKIQPIAARVCIEGGSVGTESLISPLFSLGKCWTDLAWVFAGNKSGVPKLHIDNNSQYLYIESLNYNEYNQANNVITHHAPQVRRFYADIWSDEGEIMFRNQYPKPGDVWKMFEKYTQWEDLAIEAIPKDPKSEYDLGQSLTPPDSGY